MPAADVQCSVPDARVPLILAGAVFVFIDDGGVVASDYPILQRVVLHEAKRFPNGIAGLIIIPKKARPPREEIRTAIRETLHKVREHIVSICWCVEGSGFQGAAARAVLSGLVMLVQPRYPTQITSELRAALAWSYAKAGGSHEDVTAVVEQIRALRGTAGRQPLAAQP